MSTRSMIGILQPSGAVRAVYCHSDGYPEHVGAILASHYATSARAAALVALGDLSQLHPKIAPPAGASHRFGAAAPGVCIAYGRDRGDKDTDATTYAEAEAFFVAAVGPNGVGEFAYLWCPVSGWWISTDKAPAMMAPLCLILSAEVV